MNNYILSGGGAVEIVSWDNLRARVNELSGREIGPYVAAKVGTYGSTEVACEPGSPGDLQFGRTFTVKLSVLNRGAW